jgi:hypothetical protein
VKLARFRKPKATCFLSYVEYISNTNTSNIMKNRSPKGRSPMRERWEKKEVKKVNMVDVLPIQK